MPRKNSYPTVTDQFCGAGGSSQGAQKAGAEVKMAMNHWKLAIETHSTNFPKTDHDCSDISAVDPRRYPSTDILITSPECTNHSLAKGKKIVKKQMDMYDSGELDPAAERSRATMWDVCRFAEYHNYNAIIVENVVDARKWVMFDSWIMAMRSMNYMHKCVYMNSMHAHPTPQSRDRMYVVFWKKGNKAPDLDFTPSAWCAKCSTDILSIQSWKKEQRSFKYKTGYLYCCPSCSSVVEPYYHAAFNCIDWSDLGIRIGDRKKALSPKTITRIQYGLDTHGNNPFQVLNFTPGYTKPVIDPTGSITCQDHHAICNPFLVDQKQSSGINYRVRGAHQAVNTIHTDPRLKLVVPFIIKFEHGQPVSAADKALHTHTTRQSMGVVTPFLTTSRGQSKTARITESLKTISAGGIHSGIVSDEAWSSFIINYYNKSTTTVLSDPLGTVTTTDRVAIINYQKPRIEDCYYRMLKAQEIKLAMAFDKEYIVLGSSKNQVKQLGNAVTPPAMEWLMDRVMKSLK